MISKQLEKKMDIFLTESMEEIKKPIELEYYLLESYMSDCCELAGTMVYGIEITKKINDESYETEYVKNLSCCKDNVKQILNKLAENTVTPVGLPFVLDDILGL